jgi:HD-like signal output (HDOD) protein
MAGLSELLTIKRLPAMPATLAKAIPMLLDPESEWEELERVLRQDEALAAALLRLANSARYGGSGRYSDLHEAMVRLGRDALRQCVLEQQVAGVLAGDNAAFGLQRGAMWRSSLAGAIAAESLARRHAPEDASVAFVCGLMRDIGKLALNVKYGAGYQESICAHESEQLSFIEVERAALGFDHAAVGGALARAWKLPERVALCIEAHHAPPPPGPGHDALFDVVHAADVICLWAGLGVGLDGMEYRLAAHVRDGLGLDRRSAEREIALVWEKLREAEEALGEAGAQGEAS